MLRISEKRDVIEIEEGRFLLDQNFLSLTRVASGSARSLRGRRSLLQRFLGKTVIAGNSLEVTGRHGGCLRRNGTNWIEDAVCCRVGFLPMALRNESADLFSSRECSRVLRFRGEREELFLLPPPRRKLERMLLRAVLRDDDHVHLRENSSSKEERECVAAPGGAVAGCKRKAPYCPGGKAHEGRIDDDEPGRSRPPEVCQVIFRGGLTEAYLHSFGRCLQERLGNADSNAVIPAEGIPDAPENTRRFFHIHDGCQLLRCSIPCRFFSGSRF